MVWYAKLETFEICSKVMKGVVSVMKGVNLVDVPIFNVRAGYSLAIGPKDGPLKFTGASSCVSQG